MRIYDSKGRGYSEDEIAAIRAELELRVNAPEVAALLVRLDACAECEQAPLAPLLRDAAAMLRALSTLQPQGDATPQVSVGGECNCASGRGAEHCVIHAPSDTLARYATPQVPGDGEWAAALMVVNDAANEARHSGDYQRANTLVRARVTLARAVLSTPQARQQITSDMIREAEAHYPAALDAESTRNSRWHWFADYYNNALAKPNEPCPCCNVTPDGDILDHLQLRILS